MSPATRRALFAVALAVLPACGPAAHAPGRAGGIAPGRIAPAPDDDDDLDGDDAPPPVNGIATSTRGGLTASDGTGLELGAIEAKIALADPFALTELRLLFENPTDRTVEGTFTWELPEGATLARFAMRIQGDLVEGEVVPRGEGRAAYEEILHRRRDPALLEEAGGGAYRARIFPIAPRQTKEIVLSYTELLGSRADYTLHLGGLPKVRDLHATAYDGGRVVAENRASHVAPQDWSVPSGSIARRAGVRAGDLALVRARVTAATALDVPQRMVAVVDTSASRHGTFDATAAILGALASRMAAAAPSATLTVIAADQTRATLFRGEAAAYDAATVRAKLLKRGALGASNLAAALADAAATAQASKTPRVVVFTDGLATLGPVDGHDIVSVARQALARAGVSRVDVVVGGEARDDALLAALATGGVRTDDRAVPHVVVDRLLAGSAPRPIRIEGARAVFPEYAPAGADEVVVVAEMERSAPASVRLAVGDEVKSIALVPFEPLLLGRAHAAARIARLLGADGPPTTDVRREVVALSMAHRVPSPFTSMLVLEPDASPEARAAASSAPVLVVGGAGQVAAAPRPKQIAPPRAPGAPERRWGEDLDAPAAEAHLWGTAHGAGTAPLRPTPPIVAPPRAPASPPISLPPAGVAPPAVTPDKGAVAGRVPPEVIQRGVQAKLRDLRRCYEDALRRVPDLSGRMTVTFTIAATGAVVAAAADGPFSQEMRACVSDVIRHARFDAGPAPIRIVYPLSFRASDDGRVLVGPAAPTGDAAPRPPARTTPPRAYTGRMAPIMELLAAGASRDALRAARAWHTDAPTDVVALMALGQTLAANGRTKAAARAFGSIIDLHPSQAELRRVAGEQLDALGSDAALAVAIDSYTKALADRPEHPSGHRLLAYALARAGALDRAFTVIEHGAAQPFADGRFSGASAILRDDAGLIGAAWTARDKGRRGEVERRLAQIGAKLEETPSLRFVLVWETDESDLDFHVVDGNGDHAFFGERSLPSGGALYGDITTGFGPECFTVWKDRAAREASAGGYHLRAQYFAQGPAGYGMGKLEVIEHDGRGGLTFDERPFLLMEDGATIDLGDAR